jgi:D-glycero-alpha-D-manno-heptose-7-phosphate kinase
MNFVKAPLRISYVGGGTDYPEFFKHNTGAGVIAAAIDQYVYLYAHPLSEVADENLRFTYRETESVQKIEDLKHPVMREMLRDVKWRSRTNFGTFADLPSGVGLGGSSSFAVALATLICNDSILPLDRDAIAKLAIRIERDVLGEAGGIQDQYVAAFGGFRRYGFESDAISVSENLLDPLSIAYLEERQLLIWLGTSRDSSSYAEHTRSVINTSRSLLKETVNLLEVTDQAISNSSSPVESFNAIREAVYLGWDLKKKFTNRPHPIVKEIELKLKEFPQAAMKLCGAGGTGFLLLLAEPETLKDIKSSMPNYKTIQPKIDHEGSTLLNK